MKRYLISILFFLPVIISLTGCLKSAPINADPNGATNIITMEYFVDISQTTLNSGLNYFSNGALTYPSSDAADTATFAVHIAGGAVNNKDVTVTLGSDANALKDNYSNDSIVYIIMPDSIYHLVSNTATIKAGSSSATFQVIFYPSKIDPTKNFMLPLTVVSNTANYTVSSNYGHIYFHTIGNPLAGSYTWNYTRWNDADTSGTPVLEDDGESATFSPDNPTTVEVQSGYGAQNGFNVRYVLSFTNNGGILSNPSVSINSSDVSGNLTPNSITLTVPASILSADLKTMHFRFTFGVTNGSGLPRTVIDEYYK